MSSRPNDRLDRTTDFQTDDTDDRQCGTPTDAKTAVPAGTDAGAVPATIGPYRVIECLGRGGQGEVYRAAHPTLGRDVVVKLAAREIPAAQRERVFEEGRVLARLDDPGLVRVYDANLHEGRPYVVFEYVKGRSLADKIRKGPMPMRAAVSLVAEIAGVVERVHEEGVLHRDLKPANVLIDSRGDPRLLDFGLASMTGAYVESATEVGVSGTPAYMSPEQANGENEELGPATDVFGLGAVLYELVTGRPPHSGGNVAEVLERARRGKVKPARKRNPAVPASLDRILARALNADPEERHPSAAAFARDLRGYLRRPKLLLAGAALVFLGVALGVVLVTRPWKDRERPFVPPDAARHEPPGPAPTPAGSLPQPPTGWKWHESSDGYAVLFPGDPAVKNTTTDGPKKVLMNAAQFHDRKVGLMYNVTVSDFEGKLFIQPREALKAGRDEGMANVNARVVSEKDVAIDRYPGLESFAKVETGDLKGCWVMTRFYLVRQRAYLQLVIGIEDTHRTDDPEVLHFLNSFRLVPVKD